MSSTLSDEQKIAVFREMASGWENKQWRKCADLLAPNGVLQSMMKEPVAGREAFYERMVHLAAPNKKVTLHVHRLGVIDGAVVSERTDEIVIDGISRSVRVVGIMEFDGPLISLWREYYDLAQLLRAQGKGD
ncbi:nuclear transport factor 2 family protein [Polaromonas sp. P2-4]|nr:nuclear transport factor 2 family protein [Polaromonas sp. P2-4]